MQNSEAEITSLNQKRRINELEAQLDEAEGLIIDLRANLSQVQDQLDDVKSKYIQSLRQTEKLVMPCQNMIYENEQRHFAPFKSFSELEPEAVTSEILASTSDQSIMDNDFLPSAKETERVNTDFDNCPLEEPGFAYAIAKSKKRNLSKNRCTQGICAIESGLVDVKLHSADEVISLLENVSTNRRNEQNEMTESMPLSRTDKSCELDISMEQDALLKKNTADDQPVKLQKMRRRRTRYDKVKAISCKYQYGQIMKSRRRTFAISHCESNSKTNSDVQRSGCVSNRVENINGVDYCALEEKVHLAKHQTVSVTRRSVRKRKTTHWDGFDTSCRMKNIHSHRNDKSCHPDLTVKCDKKASKRVFEVDDGGELEQGICIKAASAGVPTCMDSGEGFTFLRDVTAKDARLINMSKSEKQDGLASEFGLEDVSLVFSDSIDLKSYEMTGKCSSQPDSKTPLRYTFSRKRKKRALTNTAEKNSFQQSSVNKRSGEETECALALESNNHVSESSADGSRLLQVARQVSHLSLCKPL